MSILANSTCTRYWKIRNANGLPPASISSASYKIVSVDSTSSMQTTPVSITNWDAYTPTMNTSLGSVTVTLAPKDIPRPGTYREYWTATDDTSLVHNEDRLVKVVDAVFPIMTLRDIRHAVSSLIDDVWFGTVTSTANSSSFVDVDRTESDHTNDWAYFYAGQAKGQERRVVSWSQSASTFTFNSVYNPAPAIGDLYELHKYFKVSDYNRAINLAITQVAYHALVPVTDETLLMQANTYPSEYQVPNGLLYVSDVWTRDESSNIATMITTASDGQTLPQSTINVVSTTGFKSSGIIMVQIGVGAWQTVNYTGTTSTTFTGCTSGLGTMAYGGTVVQSNTSAPNNPMGTDWVQLDLSPTKKDAIIIPGRRIIRFKNPKQGNRVRFVGQMLPVTLNYDDEVSDVFPHYLIFKAAAHLLSGKMTRAENDVLGASARSQLFHQEAEAVRPDRKPLPGSFRLM